MSSIRWLLLEFGLAKGPHKLRGISDYLLARDLFRAAVRFQFRFGLSEFQFCGLFGDLMKERESAAEREFADCFEGLAWRNNTTMLENGCSRGGGKFNHSWRIWNFVLTVGSGRRTQNSEKPPQTSLGIGLARDAFQSVSVLFKITRTNFGRVFTG